MVKRQLLAVGQRRTKWSIDFPKAELIIRVTSKGILIVHLVTEETMEVRNLKKITIIMESGTMNYVTKAIGLSSRLICFSVCQSALCVRPSLAKFGQRKFNKRGVYRTVFVCVCVCV